MKFSTCAKDHQLKYLQESPIIEISRVRYNDRKKRGQWQTREYALSNMSSGNMVNPIVPIQE